MILNSDNIESGIIFIINTRVEQCADSCNLTLLHDDKLTKNPSTVQDGRKATMHISNLHLEAVNNRSYPAHPTMPDLC